MPRQLEGSRAVAEAVALCRPEVICAYPISPQTHIVENLSQLVKSGELAPCEFVNVESEFAAMSASIGASATGARAYTATASQGLLYMTEALYNASGLGLPIVMTVANRAIGAPINIWNDHSDSMSQRDSRLDPAVRRDQPGGARPAHPGLPPGRGALHAGDGLHGRLHPHPRRRARRDADPGAGRRVPAAVPAAPGARPRRADHDRRDGRPGGVHGGQVPRARQADAGARADPRDRRRLRATPSGATPVDCCAAYRTEDAETIVVALGSVLGTIKDTVDELRERGRQDRRRRRSPRSARSRSRRCAPRSDTPSACSCSRRRSPSASAGSSPRTSAWRSRASSCTATRRSRVSAGARSRRRRCAGCSWMPPPTPRAADVPRHRLGRREPRARADALLAHLRSPRREHPARRRARGGGPGMRSARA